MRIRTALAAVGVTAGLTGLAVATGPAVSNIADASATVTSTAATAAPSSSARCDDERWVGPDGINVNGRPDRFDAGNAGGVYLWHGVDGWHLRTTDIAPVAHHYQGTIALSTGGRFTSFSTVRLENGDRVWVDGANVLHYDVTTFRGIDGLNFTVSDCDHAAGAETLRFTMDFNGHEDDPGRIRLGDTQQHPPSATFTATRTV